MSGREPEPITILNFPTPTPPSKQKTTSIFVVLSAPQMLSGNGLDGFVGISLDRGWHHTGNTSKDKWGHEKYPSSNSNALYHKTLGPACKRNPPTDRSISAQTTCRPAHQTLHRTRITAVRACYGTGTKDTDSWFCRLASNASIGTKAAATGPKGSQTPSTYTPVPLNRNLKNNHHHLRHNLQPRNHMSFSSPFLVAGTDNRWGHCIRCARCHMKHRTAKTKTGAKQ